MMASRSQRHHQQDTLGRLITETAEFSVEFPHLLANHLPMVLFALHELGGSSERLEEYFETYRDTNRLVPVPPTIGAIDRSNWQAHLGERAREADYRAFFASEGRRLGRRGLLENYLPQLIPGIAASALHALMRIAYATLRGDPDETAIGVAYLCSSHLPLRKAGFHPPDTANPAAVLLGMQPVAAYQHIDTESDLLWHWMRATAAIPEFDGLVDKLQIGPDGLDRVAAVSIRLMAATMTFEAVHAVTGSHWLRIVRGHGCDDEALRYFWQAIASVYPKIGMPSLPDEGEVEEIRKLDCPEWPEIAAAAAASDDEHDLSYVFSAREEHRYYGDRLYQVTAARRMGLIA